MESQYNLYLAYEGNGKKDLEEYLNKLPIKLEIKERTELKVKYSDPDAFDTSGILINIASGKLEECVATDEKAKIIDREKYWFVLWKDKQVTIYKN